MARALWLKIGAIVGLAVALLIPLKLIEGKIEERKATRNAVVAELAETSVGPQVVTGPVLVLPCTDHYVERQADGKLEKRMRDCTRNVVPEQLSMSGSLKTESRYRGIYSARFFTAGLRIEGRFDIPPETVAEKDVRRALGQPIVLLSVRDVRGIRSAATLTWDGNPYVFKPGIKPDIAGGGMHAAVGVAATASGPHTFSFPVEIAGLQKLSFVPSAREHDVKLTADWPHPSFTGRHLPATREIGSGGFQAAWRISELASEASRLVPACVDPACKILEPYVFGVSLVDPVDVYVQANRAVKYALLFVLLTFSAFFLFEIMRELRIHAVQYGLVGLALAMFFLLLIALSEHIRFLYAYAISASACVILIAVYVQAVLRSAVRALAFAGMLSALYTMLYALLRSEDYSLLMGALLVFAALAAVMLLTRKVNWYAIAPRPAS